MSFLNISTSESEAAKDRKDWGVTAVTPPPRKQVRRPEQGQTRSREKKTKDEHRKRALAETEREDCNVVGYQVR